MVKSYQAERRDELGQGIGIGRQEVEEAKAIHLTLSSSGIQDKSYRPLLSLDVSNSQPQQ
jgi:small ligand-binding sensory domain FIST